MEQTPFDDVPFASTSHATGISANLPPSRPTHKTKNPKLFSVPITLLLLVGGGFGASYWQKQQEARAREEKLAALRQDIKKIVLQDNALVLEMLDDGALEHITYAEFFKRADKNKEERDVLIRNLRATETGPYGEQVGNFVKLMETENEWVRSEEAVSRSTLDLSGKWDLYKSAIASAEEAVGSVSKARRDYEAAPYGEDYSESAALSYAHARLDSQSESARSVFDEWKKASDDQKEKKSSAAVVIADWMRTEPLYYPNFAPKRALTDLLVKKKRDYVGEPDSDSPKSSDSAPKTASPKIIETSSSLPAALEPTPAPSLPTRERSLKPLEGERFPTTRTDPIDTDYAANLSDDDLRYAINEMFARYGMTFKDKSYQANFDGKSWYSPNDKWKPAQIKRAMTARERTNLDVLVAERSARNTRGE